MYIHMGDSRCCITETYTPLIKNKLKKRGPESRGPSCTADAFHQATPLLVPDDFQGHQFIVFMIQALGHLSKGPHSNHLQNLIAVGDVVV